MTWGASVPAVVSDAQRALIDILDGMGFPTGAWYPTDATPEAPSIPFVAVIDLGAPNRTYIGETASLQITAWETNPTPAKELREDIVSELTIFNGSSSVAWIRPGPRQGVVEDDITGYWLAAFTVRAFMRSTHK